MQTYAVSLPGLIEPSIARPAPVYTARPDWTSPHESAWSLISKFQVLNRLSQTRFAHAVGLLSAGLSPNGCDLRTSQAFGVATLGDALRLPQDRIDQSFCAANRDDELLDGAADVLRFCSACLQQAYHSPLTQFCAISRCPIHRTRLRTACPRCRHEIPYRLNPALVERPYCCPHCEAALCPGVSHPRGLAQPLSAVHVAQLDYWRQHFHWAAGVLRIGIRPTRRVAETGAPRITTTASSHVTKRLAFIGELQRRYRHPPPRLHTDAAFTRDMLTALPPWRASLPMIRCYRYADRWRRLGHLYVWLDIFYRKQCDHLLHTLDATTRDCEVLRRTQLLDNWIDLSTTVLPASAAALLAFRMNWEGRFKPCTLHDPDGRYPAFGIFEWLAFAPCRPAKCRRAEWDAALIRRFVLDLDRVWQAWFDIPTWMHAQGGYFLHPHLVPIRALWLDAEAC